MMHASAERSLPSRESLHARLVHDLRECIVRGEIAEGVRVPEGDLCARFGVSRTPLREALKSLAAEGFVTLRPNRGAIVTPLDRDDVMQAFEAKGLLEHFIGLNATDRATEVDLRELASIHSRLISAEQAGDTDSYTGLNSAFHRRMAELAGNREILAFYERLQSRILLVRFRINLDPVRLRTSLSEHQGIIDALLVRARLDVAARLVAHNESTAAVVLDELSSLTP